jgi:hypothetical protein
MERETKTIKTPSGVNVEIKTYITGREVNELEDIIFNEVNLSAVAGEKKPGANVNFNNASFIRKQIHRTIEIMVVSVNESKEDVLNKILDLKKEDYQFVMQEIDKVTKEDDQSTDIKKK